MGFKLFQINLLDVSGVFLEEVLNIGVFRNILEIVSYNKRYWLKRTCKRRIMTCFFKSKIHSVLERTESKRQNVYTKRSVFSLDSIVSL